MLLLAHRPAEPLASSIETLWYCEDYDTSHAHERVLPSGAFQLIIDLAAEHDESAIVIGMQTHYGVIETAQLRSVIGVFFRPGGAHGIIDVPADAFANQVVPLERVWGSSAAALRDRLRDAKTPAAKFEVFEAALHCRMVHRRELHAAVRHALRVFRRSPHIDRVVELSKGASLSRRRLADLFREQVGLTPKLYCRLHRFQQVVGRIAAGGAIDWVDVALAGGFCDQAHLVNEFREFSGLSPGAYLDADRPFPTHVRMG